MLRRVPRLVASILAVALSLGISAAPVLAGNTRTVFFGSPGTTTQSNGLGILTTTPVTAGSDTAFDVELQNLSPSELTHVLIQGGGAAPDPLANPNYPAPSPICPTGATSSSQCIPSLPPGTSYVTAFVTSSTVSTSCTVSSSSLSCSVANMAPNDFTIIRVVLLPPAQVTSTDIQFWLAASLKEGTSSSGSNQDTFFAYGQFPVTAPSCVAVSNFFLQNQQVNLSNTQGGSCSQATNISSNALFGQGAFSQVGASPSTFCAPGITTCFGEGSQANVNNGVQPNGTYVQWDIVWTGSDLPSSGKPSGVIHFLDGYDPVTNPNAFVVIYFKPKYQCSKTLTTNCWVTTNSTTTSFEAIFRTPNNGLIRGF